jgi:two-component system OmpR family response regulator
MTGTVHKLLLVEDDEDIVELVTGYFETHGLAVHHAADSASLRTIIQREVIDLVLLDLGLPGEDGLLLLRWLRDHTAAPVIVVSGRGAVVDRVVGLELGADDYIAKPFDLRELLARVRTALRRRAGIPAPAAAAAPQVWHFAGYRVDLGARTVRRQGGEEVVLTTGEYNLLLAFLNAPLKVLSRDDLLQATHGRDAAPYDKTIDVQVGRLRRKIERDPANPELIKAVRAAGYVLAVPVTPGA